MRSLSQIKYPISFAVCTNCKEIFIDDYPLFGSYICPNCKSLEIALVRGFDSIEDAENYLDELNEKEKKNKRKIIIYISGAYMGNDGGRSINKNILLAREYAIKLWELGYTVICPHLNTQFFERDCNCKQEDFVEGDCEIVKRCNSLFVLSNYIDSKGAQKEIKVAKENNLPIFYKIEDIEKYYEN